jgi:hypothetical protein
MGDQLQQIVSRPDQGAVVAHPSTLADIERIRNNFQGVRSRAGLFTITSLARLACIKADGREPFHSLCHQPWIKMIAS